MQVGERVLHFDIDRRLGRGGMGEVYLAWDRRFERRVALKFLRAGRHPALLRPLVEEAIAASRLHVDSVITIHADYESPAGPFLCMEYLPAGSLQDRLQEGPLPLEDALRIGLSVAKALEAAHEAGILHCDLKPGNVLLSPGGAEAAKVADFGLARSMAHAAPGRRVASDEAVSTDAGDAAVRAGRAPRRHAAPPDSVVPTLSPIATPATPGLVLIGGTRGYMSPEQERGEPLDARSDLFALGVLLYEMPTGNNPRRAQRGVRTSAPARPYSAAAGRRRRPEFPAAYWRLVESLTDPEPERRPQHASAVSRALRHLLTSAPSRRVADGTTAAAAPLFGRDAEREALGEALGRLLDGRGDTWLIEGSQGAGKTALVEGFRREAAARGAVVLGGSCLPRPAPRPYAPFLELVEGFLAHHETLDDRERFLRLETGLPAEVAAFLCDAVRPPSRELPPLAGRSQLRDALRTFAFGLAREQSVLLVLDDLQLADAASAELFASWAQVAPEVPLLLVGTYEPGSPMAAAGRADPFASVRERTLAAGAAHHLKLGPLERSATEQLLAALLPMLPAGHPGFDQVHWRTGGLPGFVVELARLARQSGSSLRAIERVLGGVMPESIRASLTLRMKQLEPAGVDLLRAAAVAGERFAPSLLSAAGLGSAARQRPRLAALERTHHLVRREEEDRYRFDNPQVREFVLSTTPPEIQRELHGRLADGLQTLAGSPPPGLMARLLLGAGRPERAGRFLRAAARSALTVFAEEEALHFADVAERNLPAGRRGDALRRDIHLIRALALEALGHYAEARGHADEAVRLAQEQRSRSALGEALVTVGRLQHAVGETQRAESTLRRAESHCRAGRNSRGMIRGMLLRGNLRYERGRIPAAASLYRKALAASHRSRDPVMKTLARANLANVQVALGDLERAADGYRETIEFHRRRGDPRTAATAEGNLGLIRLKQGRIDEARALFTDSLRTRNEIGDRRGVAAMELRLARCSLVVGRVQEARRHARRAQAIAERVGEPRLACQAELVVAECLVFGGRTRRAATRLDVLLERSEHLGEKLQVNVLEILARARVADGDLEGAARHARDARKLSSRLGNPAEEMPVGRVEARVLLGRHRFRDVLRALDDGSSGARRARRREPDVEGEIEASLLRAVASRAASGRAAGKARRASRAEYEHAQATIAQIRDELAYSADRRSFASRWRKEMRQIERLAGLTAGRFSTSES